MMQVIQINNEIYLHSWVDGIVKTRKELSFHEEARRWPESAINRLIALELWDQAEEVMDKFLI